MMETGTNFSPLLQQVNDHDNVTLDPRTCIFCHLDAIFQVARTKKNGKKKHDHFDHISKMTVDQKLIYVFVELFSNYTHVETKFNDVFSADHVNAFLTKYLPRSVPSKTFSGVQLKTLEKLLRKVVAVYTANGLISPEEKNTFHEELLSTRKSRISTTQPGRKLPRNRRMGHGLIQPRSSPQKYICEICEQNGIIQICCTCPPSSMI